MAVELTTRLRIPRWPLGTDPYLRSQRNATADELEARVALYGSGTLAARPAPAAANAGTYYTVTDPTGGGTVGALYYSDGTKWTEAGGASAVDAAARLMTPGSPFTGRTAVRGPVVNMPTANTTYDVVTAPPAGFRRIIKSVVITNYTGADDTYDLYFGAAALAVSVPIKLHSVVTLDGPFVLTGANTFRIRTGNDGTQNATATYYDVPDVGAVAGGTFANHVNLPTSPADSQLDLVAAPAGLDIVVTTLLFALQGSGNARPYSVDSRNGHGLTHTQLAGGDLVVMDVPLVVPAGSALRVAMSPGATSGACTYAAGYYR